MFALLGVAAALGSALLASPALPLANSTTVSGNQLIRTRSLFGSLWRRITAVNHPVNPKSYCMGERV
jgi:hypothetical protein